MDPKFLPKFVTLDSRMRRQSSSRSIYAVLGYHQEKDLFQVMDIIDGKLFCLRVDTVIACHYDNEMVWGVGDNWAYYDKNSLRAQRKDGPAALIEGKKVFCWKNCITYDKEKFFEYLTKEEKIEAAFNIDEF